MRNQPRWCHGLDFLPGDSAVMEGFTLFTVLLNARDGYPRDGAAAAGAAVPRLFALYATRQHRFRCAAITSDPATLYLTT